MREGCICGCLPPREPNPDCERCDFVCEVEQLQSELTAARERAEKAEEALLQIWNYTPLSENVFWPNSVKRVVIKLWDALTLPEKADKIAAWQQAHAAAGIEEPPREP